MDTPQITPKTNPGENSDNSSNDDRGIGHQALTQYGGGTTQLTVGNQVSTFKEGLVAVENHFGAEAAGRIRNGLATIDSLERNSIANLKARGEVVPAIVDAQAAKLRKDLDVNVDGLTIDEAQRAYEFAFGTDSEEQKINRAWETFQKFRNGVSVRRDFQGNGYYDQDMADWMERVGKRFEDWEDGKLDTEIGFDVDEAYYNHIKEYPEENGYLFRNYLETEDIETLQARGDIDENSMYVCGPFTRRDLETMGFCEDKVWAEYTGRTYQKQFAHTMKPKRLADMTAEERSQKPYREMVTGTSLSRLMDQTIHQKTEPDPAANLVYDYISSEILQERRLNAKDLTVLTSAVVIDALNIEKVEDEKKVGEYNKMRRSIGQIARYLGIIYNRPKEELKARFGSTQPKNADYFEEIAKEAESLSPERAKYVDETHAINLTRIDEHLHQIMNSLAVLTSEASFFADEDTEDLD